MAENNTAGNTAQSSNAQSNTPQGSNAEPPAPEITWQLDAGEHPAPFYVHFRAQSAGAEAQESAPYPSLEEAMNAALAKRRADRTHVMEILDGAYQVVIETGMLDQLLTSALENRRTPPA